MRLKTVVMDRMQLKCTHKGDCAAMFPLTKCRLRITSSAELDKKMNRQFNAGKLLLSIFFTSVANLSKAT